MSRFKNTAILLSDRLGLQQLLSPNTDAGLTTILFHGFRFEDESWDVARSRLKRQIAFLATHYQPVSLADISTQAGSGQGIGKAPLLVTVDDAKRDIMEVHDLFKAAEIPVAQFVCAGWTAQASGHHNDDEAHLRVTAHLRFHAQKGETFDFEGRTYTLDTDGNTALIDALIMSDDRDTWLIAEERLNCPQPDQNLCTWSELRDLRDAGMTIGCHSVSHPRIARQSAVRRKFEIEASRFGIELQLGHSPYFAYPYGTPDSHDDSTLACLRAAGFVTAFTTRSAHRSKDDDPLVLPRIAMPEAVMPQAVFEARVKGAGIALQRVAGWIKP